MSRRPNDEVVDLEQGLVEQRRRHHGGQRRHHHHRHHHRHHRGQDEQQEAHRRHRNNEHHNPMCTRSSKHPQARRRLAEQEQERKEDDQKEDDRKEERKGEAMVVVSVEKEEEMYGATVMKHADLMEDDSVEERKREDSYGSTMLEQPCQMDNCPFNPEAKYMCGKAERALFSRASSSSSPTDDAASSLRIHKKSVDADNAGNDNCLGSECSERKCLIILSMSLVLALLVASIAVFAAYNYLRSQRREPSELVLKGNFVVSSDDFVLPEGAVDSYVHAAMASVYQKKIDELMARSRLKEDYRHNEVFLLEGHGSSGTTVHFNVHMAPRKGDSAQDVKLVLMEDVSNKEQSVFADLNVDPDSIDIKERSDRAATTESSAKFDADFTTSTEKSEATKETAITSTEQNMHHHEHEPESNTLATLTSSITERMDRKQAELMRRKQRQCVPIVSKFCADMPYNFTAFPNALGHNSFEEMTGDEELLKQVVDSKCHPYAYELVCQLLQPLCHEQRVLMPCQDFCSDFVQACANVMPDDIARRIRCFNKGIVDNKNGGLINELEDDKGIPEKECISAPGCVADLRRNGLDNRICDGTLDCSDYSDELYCDYCPEQHFHCGVGKSCVPEKNVCDGHVDCENAADEAGCLALTPEEEAVRLYALRYFSSGLLVFRQGSSAGKVCADDLSKTVPASEMDAVLDKLGHSMCQLLQYQSLEHIDVVHDHHGSDHELYVDMTGPMSDEKAFIGVPCRERKVVRIECGSLRCGQRPASVPLEQRARDATRSVSLHGDWPWHVSLMRDGNHVCDGLLVHNRLVLTASKCFEESQKALWTARVGSVRDDASSPFEQTRVIMGMTSSDNGLTLLRLEQEFHYSDQVRHACLAHDDHFVHMGAPCFTLAWNASDHQLHHVTAGAAARDKCNDASDSSRICVKEKGDPVEVTDDTCFLDAMVGSPLVCHSEDAWHVVGLAASAAAGCDAVPYHRVAVDAEWVEASMRKLTQNASDNT